MPPVMRPSGNEFQDFCTAYGLVLLTWGWAENTLAMTIGIINKAVGPIKGHPEAPIALKKRIACLKAALRDIPALELLQEEGRALAAFFVKLAPRRHELVHSSTWQVPQGGLQGVSFSVERGDYSIKDHRFNVGDALLLAGETAKLQDDALAFMLRVTAILGST